MKYKIPKEANLTLFKGKETWYCSKIDIQSLLEEAVENAAKNIARDLLKLSDKYESEDTRMIVEEYFENEQNL